MPPQPHKKFPSAGRSTGRASSSSSSPWLTAREVFFFVFASRHAIHPHSTGYKRFGSLQGHHWSLLICINQDSASQGFYHFDSAPGEEHRLLAAEAASFFAPLFPGCLCARAACIAKLLQMRIRGAAAAADAASRCCAAVRAFAGMPRQANSHDCGAMLAASAEWILAQYLAGCKFPWDAAGALLLRRARACCSCDGSELAGFVGQGDCSAYRLKCVGVVVMHARDSFTFFLE
jgi:hypothetical protein